MKTGSNEKVKNSVTRSQRGLAALYLAAEIGNFVRDEDTGRMVERVDMVGGKYLSYGERGRVNGFMNLSEALDYIGLALKN